MRKLRSRGKNALLSIAGFAMLAAFWQASPAPAGPRPGTGDDDDGEDEHDALDRAVAREQLYPTVGEQVMTQWDAIRRSEAERWADRLPGRGQHSALAVKIDQVPGQSWVNLGPTDATIEYNDNNFF